MKKSLILAFSLASAALFAQKPYFQQDVAYTINVSLDDEKHELNADEKLVYKNNSPDVLPFIWMHVWPNAYKNQETALCKQLTENGESGLHFASAEDRGFIDQLDFKVDGQAVKIEAHPQHIDIVKLVLNTPLQPGGQITITTPFHVKIPSGKFSRLGHIDQQYQITQWYPKPAVYDRNGWNEMPYLDQGEFYSEFGIYAVFITLPKNYVLGATGDIQNNPEELKWLNQKVEATKEKKSFDEKENSFPASDAEKKTIHYHQEKVHDFAWFCDKRYHVLKGDVELPNTKRHVTTWLMFTNQYAKLWKEAIPYINDALYYYSKWNGDYAYNHCTAVDGALSAGGGMEYPNITVIGGVSGPFSLEMVIMHEVGHNWFYGMLGSNERVHGWMDEGINSFNELRYTETKYPNKALAGGKEGASAIAKKFDLGRYKQKAQYYQLYSYCSHQNKDQACETHSAEFTTMNYASVMYMNTAVVFDYLRAYLGDELFDKAMMTYFDRWSFKHPMPDDLRKVLEEVSGKQLGWFFDDMIGSTKRLDYKIAGAKNNSSSWDVEVKNCGEILGPVMVCAVKDGKIVQTVWSDGFSGSKKISVPAGDYDYFMIDQPEDMPEWNRKNNTLKTSGLLKKAEPFKLQLGGSLENPTRT
ncbi:MAG: M1 family metallopeptidase, partial [Bacteroidia bacterium]